MVRSVNGNTVFRLALVGVAAASLAACASKPKPTYPTQTPPATQAQPPRTELPPAQPGVSQQPMGALPGSTQDFVVNVGDRVYFDTDSHDVREDAKPLLDAQSSWLRRYGSVVHSGFGLGVERTVAWVCGLDHVRETIAFPRTLTNMRP